MSYNVLCCCWRRLAEVVHGVAVLPIHSPSRKLTQFAWLYIAAAAAIYFRLEYVLRVRSWVPCTHKSFRRRWDAFGVRTNAVQISIASKPGQGEPSDRLSNFVAFLWRIATHKNTICCWLDIETETAMHTGLPPPRRPNANGSHFCRINREPNCTVLARLLWPYVMRIAECELVMCSMLEPLTISHCLASTCTRCSQSQVASPLFHPHILRMATSFY